MKKLQKKLQNKKTKLGAIGYAISGGLFMASIAMPVTSELIYALLCFSTSLVSWGIYDRGVRDRERSAEILENGLFQKRDIDGFVTKTPRIKSRGVV